MFKEQDDKKGLVRVYWQDIRDRVAEVDSVMAKIIDELNPNKTLPLYLAYYPYGAIIAETTNFYLPYDQGYEGFKLTDENISKILLDDLGYAKNTLPMGMVLEKNIEYTINFQDDNGSMPYMMYPPGSFFPFNLILGDKNKRVYSPNNLFSITAGNQSAFMLPNIGSVSQHAGLQRDYNIQSAAPKKLNEHWVVFKEIANSKVASCDWRACVLYFTEKWIENLHNDPKWKGFRLHLHELAWQRFKYQMNRELYGVNFSVIQKQRNLKPNPYLTDTAQHLYAIAIGARPGYAPAINEDNLPLALLQKAYIESYGLTKYLPTIMQATHFDLEKDHFPIYYSLKHPSTYIFSPKSRKFFSALVEIRELEHILRIFTQELRKDNEIWSDTFMHEAAKRIKFNYFHNEQDRHHIVKMSSEITSFDNRFESIPIKYKAKSAVFADDAPFLRGSVSISI